MTSLPGYAVQSIVREDSEFVLGRGIRNVDHQRVMVELLRSSGPHGQGLQRLEHAYRVAQRIDSPAVLKPYALESNPAGPVMICEDFAGLPLRRLLGAPMPVRAMLKLAIAISDAVQSVHDCQVIHKGLTPDSIFVDEAAGAVKLTHFGLASFFPRESPAFSSPDFLPNELAYVSPEQTGRMNRLLDYRSDLYTLGVLFYELLTGRPPFLSSDPLELVHAHIAKVPPAPRELNPLVPQVLSDITMKLLAKMAEDRYQSASGLRKDLEHCLLQLDERLTIEPFALDEAATRGHFRISPKLFGRHEELGRLLGAFDRVCAGGTEFVLVSGHPGVGKSALVREVYRPVTAKRGRFVSGKFDQLRRHVPYSAVCHALGDFTSYVLMQSDDRLAEWKSRILLAVGANAQVLIDMIPGMDLVLGKQPKVAALEPIEAEARFHYVFRQFMAAISRKDHPLVLFLDDLQWAEAGTLKLLEDLLGSTEDQSLLLIGAYRDNEVDAEHPLMNTIEKFSAKISSIHLEPLGAPDVSAWLADTLACQPAGATDLALVVHEKTGGNPLFAAQFLESLHEDGLLTFDDAKSGWAWDPARIRSKSVTDNIVEMLSNRLGKLPRGTVQVLALAACLGSRFDLKTLAIVNARSTEQTAAALWPAIQEGYVIPLDENRPWNGGPSHAATPAFKFAHDRIHQAAYAFVADDQKSAEHLRIGRVLRNQARPDGSEALTFELATHFNKGKSGLTDRSERLEVAALNLQAGRKSRESSDHATARHYFRLGTELLDEQAWETHHRLAFELVRERASAECLGANYEACDALVSEGLEKVDSLEEIGELCYVRVMQYFAQARYADAFEASKSVLARLGVDLPAESRYDEVFRQEFAELRAVTARANIDDLFLAKEATSAAIRGGFKLLNYLCLVAYFADAHLYRVLVVRTVQLWLKHGYSAESSTALVWFGNLLVTAAQDYEAAYEIGLVGVKSGRQRAGSSQQCVDMHLFTNFVVHWVKHIRHAYDGMRESYRLGMLAGNLQWAGYSWMHLLTYGFYLGMPLDELLREAEAVVSFLKKTNNIAGTDIALAHYLPMLDLAGGTTKAATFGHDDGDHARYLEECHAHQTFSALCFHNVALASVYLMYDMPERAMQASLEAEKHLSFIDGMEPVKEHVFARALIAAAVCDADPSMSRETRAGHIEDIAARIARMEDWARASPENCEHKLALMKAEHGRLLGKGFELIGMYDRAAETARRDGFVQYEALANELAAKYLVNAGRPEWAGRYLALARDGYARWGAVRKVAELETAHEELAASRSTPGGGLEVASLDAMTIVKAQHAISSEMVWETFLEKMMHIVIESAGATRGCLILVEGGALVKVADAGSAGNTDLERRPLDGATDLPVDMLTYIARTLESVILDDALQSVTFVSDGYIGRAKPRSIFCLPVVRQGAPVGILYLENNLATNVFTKQRQANLQQLAAQVAISLENAMLLGRERAARAEAEEAGRRSAFLAEAGRVLAQSLDVASTLDHVVRTAVPFLASWCVVDAFNEEGQMERLAAAHEDPAREPLLRELQEHYPPRVGSPQPGARVMGTMEPLLIPEVTPEVLAGYVQNEAHADLVRRLGTFSAMALPLRARGRTLGGMTFIWSAPGRRYGAQDLALAEELAQRVASALDNAMLYRKAEAAIQLRDEFLAVASHELYTPMTSLLLVLQSLSARRLKAIDPAQLGKSMAIAERQGQRLKHLIGHLLDVTRIDQGRLTLEREQVDLVALVRDVVSSFEPVLSRAGCAVTIEAEGPVVGTWDPSRMEQVLSNLLSNAAKFGAGRPIRIGVHENSGRARIVIQDHGIGVDLAREKQLFTRFGRAVSPRHFGGLGLGLYICRHIVEGHGGWIHVESEPGVGATFTVELPCTPPDEKGHTEVVVAPTTA